MREQTMDKHDARKEVRDGDRDARSSSGADLDRGEPTEAGPDDAVAGATPGQSIPRSPSNESRNEPSRVPGTNPGFSGGHYGGFANEGHPDQSAEDGRAAWSADETHGMREVQNRLHVQHQKLSTGRSSTSSSPSKSTSKSTERE
ncbi:MAG TPA: hypothetical protein VNN99_15770 [Vicinamibacterales bacterium]|jgi:hypothetical protein|nr:hypothetical protein [Vicinamibacterales bacterium]